jgi:small basic protein (TIGR04137 family)
MSIHKSLQGAGKGGSTRNVLKRHERLHYLIAKGLWHPGQPVFGLPKIKQLKIKARKAAAKEAAPEGETAAAAPGAPAAKAPAAK